MTDFATIAQASKMAGLRLIAIRGVPSPWTQAAKGILEIKGIPFQRACAGEGEGEPELLAATGQNAYPALLHGDDPARSGWAEILLLAERLAPTPRLIPNDPSQRAWFFGLAHEICGEMGLGWSRRLCAVHGGYTATPPDPLARWLGDKYGYSPATHAEAIGRVVGVLETLTQQLAKSRAEGGEYLLGELTALDVYWATFCNLVSPLPAEQLALPEPMRPMFTASEPEVLKALDSSLLELRDRVYGEHLRLPVEL